MLLSLRYRGPSLVATFAYKRLRRALALRGAAAQRGRCPVCERDATFVRVDANRRDGLLCRSCGSVPRQRALAHVALHEFADRLDAVHESSPSLASYRFFRRHAAEFDASYFWPGLRRERVGRFRNVDLCSPSLRGAGFGMFVTQDVFEHVPTPDVAFAEVHRSLRVGGLHLFTIPRDPSRPTRARAELVDGGVRHLLPPEHHRDPISGAGAPVFTDWGSDACERIARATGAGCDVRRVRLPECGVPDEVEVFVAARDR